MSLEIPSHEKGDGSIDYQVIPAIPGYLPTASPSEQSTRIGKSEQAPRAVFYFYVMIKIY